MKDEESVDETLKGNSSDYKGNGQVVISINELKRKTRRGQHRVEELKELGGVPKAHILAQVVKGQLVDLPNDGKVQIRGGEEFYSHPDSGGSS